MVRGTGRTVPEEGSARTKLPVTSSYTAKISAYFPPRATSFGLGTKFVTNCPTNGTNFYLGIRF